MRPHVVGHLAVSADGRTTGFAVDEARSYALATLWQEDVTLIGSDTVLAQEAVIRSAPAPGPHDAGPVLAVVDSRARVREWEGLRTLGHWSEVLALYADQTPARPPDSRTRELVTGYDQVDLEEALRSLGDTRQAQVVRVEGVRLLGVLLRLGLVDELSLLVHPVVVGSGDRWEDGAGDLSALVPAGIEIFAGGLVWLRYCTA